MPKQQINTSSSKLSSSLCWSIETVYDYACCLKHLLRHYGKVVVRGTIYFEDVPPRIDSTGKTFDFKDIPNFSFYLANARAEYIWTTRVAPQTTSWAADQTSRQRVIMLPDWDWQGHPACTLAYQLISRGDFCFLHVFMRSSDLWNAFPYDLYAAVRIGERLRKLVKAECLAGIIFHTSNIHVREEDVDAIERWLNENFEVDALG